MRKDYWSFYWPLAVMGTSVLLVGQFQNGILARYPDGSLEIAVFAYAFSAFSFMRAALAFVPQTANLLARSPRAHRVCFVFIASASSALTAPLLFVGFTSLGRSALGAIFGIEDRTLDAVLLYLRWLAPLVFLHGLRQYAIGLLIQRQATRLVTSLNLIHLGTIGLVLLTGFSLGWSSARTLLAAQWSADVVHVVLLAAAIARSYRLPEPAHEDLSFGETFRFFWPVAVTSMMFAISRPVLYAFVGRGAEPVASVAALRVAFDFALFFHQPLNQFRNLFATYGTSDLSGLRRFQVQVVLVVSGIMLVVSVAPIDTWIFTHLLGIGGQVLRYAEQAFFIMCLLPLVVGFRNYFHGLALARLTTGAMAYGALLRVGAIFLLAVFARAGGWLDPAGASGILVLGFVVEAVVVIAFLRSRKNLDRTTGVP